MRVSSAQMAEEAPSVFVRAPRGGGGALCEGRTQRHGLKLFMITLWAQRCRRARPDQRIYMKRGDG